TKILEPLRDLPAPRLCLPPPRSYDHLNFFNFPSPAWGGGSGWGHVPTLSKLRRAPAAVVLRGFRRGARQRPALPGLLALREQLDLLAHDVRRLRRVKRNQAPHLPGTRTVPARTRRRLPDVPEVSADVRPAPRNACRAGRGRNCRAATRSVCARPGV